MPDVYVLTQPARAIVANSVGTPANKAADRVPEGVLRIRQSAKNISSELATPLPIAAEINLTAKEVRLIKAQS